MPSRAPYRVSHVFLDVDGTLVDLRAAFRAGNEAAAARLTEIVGRLVTPSYLANVRDSITVEPAFRGHPAAAHRAEAMRRVLATVSREDATDEVVAAYVSARNGALSAYDDVTEPLAELHARGFTLVAATNGDVDLTPLPFARSIHHTYLAVDAGIAKPDPRFFLGAMAKVGAQPATSVMVGDRIDNDVAPAVGVGMAGILLDRRGEVSDPAIHAIRSLRELPALLERA
ncbi:MAG: hypothetical protein AMXMBFR23_11560 [Chloroflexota bacterium]